jgi:flagellar basal body-associated protein FliL
MAVVNMAKPTPQKKRSKLTVALIAPVLIIAFAVGWALSFIGKPKTSPQQKPIRQTQPKKDSIELFLIPAPEEQIPAK